MRKPGLGRGLSALMEEVAGTSSNAPAPTMLSVARIAPNPNQPRKRFDEAALAELTASVKQHGVLQAILVRPMFEDGVDTGRFEIVAGERRWRAAQAAGLHEIPAIARQYDDFGVAEIAIVENIQRTDLNAMEEAEGYMRLIRDYEYSHDQIAHAVGKSRSHISNLLRLRDLPESVRDAVREGKLMMGHARALVGMEYSVAEALAKSAISGGWSVRQVEAAVRRADGAPEPAAKSARSAAPASDPNLAALEASLANALGLRVAVRAGPNGAGEVSVQYSSLDQLDLIAQRLAGEARF